jgi:hypothetical protein
LGKQGKVAANAVWMPYSLVTDQASGFGDTAMIGGTPWEQVWGWKFDWDGLENKSG